MTRGYGFPIDTFGNDRGDGHDKGRRCLADARHDKKKVGMTEGSRHDKKGRRNDKKRFCIA